MTCIKRYKTYLTRAAMIWAVSVVLFLLAYGIVLRPQNNSMKHLENTLAEQKQLYATVRKAAQEETKIQLYEEIERLRDQLKGFVIDPEESSDLTFDISQIASRENLTSLSVAYAKKSARRLRSAAGTKSEINHLSENHIDIEFTAGFRQFATFVNALERHRPVLFIDEFRITRSTQNDSVYQVTLDVAALVRKQQNNETADTALTPTFSTKI